MPAVPCILIYFEAEGLAKGSSSANRIYTKPHVLLKHFIYAKSGRRAQIPDGCPTEFYLSYLFYCICPHSVLPLCSQSSVFQPVWFGPVRSGPVRSGAYLPLPFVLPYFKGQYEANVRDLASRRGYNDVNTEQHYGYTYESACQLASRVYTIYE